jgi:hypothetical protein
MAAMCMMSLTIPGFFDIVGVLLSAALTFVAYNAFRGARRLRRLDVSGARLLAWNQIFLFGCITVYCLYCLYDLKKGMGAADVVGNTPTGDPAMDKTVQDLQNIAAMVPYVLYLGVIGGSLLGQGLAALYYATRAKHIRAYRETTPQWILDLQLASGG